MQKTLFLFFFVSQSLYAPSLIEHFKHVGYVELCDKNHGAAVYDALYVAFDEFIAFLQTDPVWAQKLYSTKERFIRSKERGYYATDFFGFYDESEREGRNQISFYYSTHFHDFICARCPEIKTVPEIMRFFEACREIQESYSTLFAQTAIELGLEEIFTAYFGKPPILFKVVKYFPAYRATRPHYDGTAFSLFLDSTDNQALLLSPYKSAFTVDDFSVPLRKISRVCDHNSILLIPGTLLSEFGIHPTPHIVMHSGNIRYATIAFAMRPYYSSPKNTFSPLPTF